MLNTDEGVVLKGSPVLRNTMNDRTLHLKRNQRVHPAFQYNDRISLLTGMLLSLRSSLFPSLRSPSSCAPLSARSLSCVPSAALSSSVPFVIGGIEEGQG